MLKLSLQQEKARSVDMNIALILAGGTGKCFGFSNPRQYVLVKDKMIITHCLQVFGAHPKINAIHIVAHEQWREKIFKQMSDAVIRKFGGFSNPGANRQRSIFQGLNDMASYARKSDIVIVHDAVRPMVSPAQISACLKACREHDGAVPVLSVRDTVYFGEDGVIRSFLDQEKIYTSQAPEAFRLGKYYKANARLMPNRIDEINDAAEPAIMAGMDIAMIPGDEANFKFTTRVDWERCKLMLNA